MKKQFTVSKIEAASDGSPYVHISFTDPTDYKSGEAKPLNPFGPEELMKNLPKAMGNIAGAVGGARGYPDSPTFKLGMREYENMSLRIGDKVSIEIMKKQDSGI